MPISWRAPASYSEHDLQKMERMFNQPLYTLLYETVNLPPRPHALSEPLTMQELLEGGPAGLRGDVLVAKYLTRRIETAEPVVEWQPAPAQRSKV